MHSILGVFTWHAAVCLWAQLRYLLHLNPGTHDQGPPGFKENLEEGELCGHMKSIQLKHFLPTENLQSQFHFLLLTTSFTVPQRFIKISFNTVISYLSPSLHSYFTSRLGCGMCGTPSLHFFLLSAFQALKMENCPLVPVENCLVALHCSTRCSQSSWMWHPSSWPSGSCFPLQPVLCPAPTFSSSPSSSTCSQFSYHLGLLGSQLLRMLLFLPGTDCPCLPPGKFIL